MGPKADAAPDSGSPPLKCYPPIGSAHSLVSAWPMSIKELGNAIHYQLHVKPHLRNLADHTTGYLRLGIKDTERGFVRKSMFSR